MDGRAEQQVVFVVVVGKRPTGQGLRHLELDEDWSRPRLTEKAQQDLEAFVKVGQWLLSLSLFVSPSTVDRASTVHAVGASSRLLMAVFGVVRMRAYSVGLFGEPLFPKGMIL